MRKTKGTDEQIAAFFERPSRESLRAILRFSKVEHDNLEFKQEWPSPAKLARHILAFANHGGGCIIVGVAENEDGTFESVGIGKVADRADLDRSLAKFLPPNLNYEIILFNYQESEYAQIIGKKFQVLIVESEHEDLPYVSLADGEGITKAAIYIRRGTSSESVSYNELQELLNLRISTGYSSQPTIDLKSEIAELKLLYSFISQTKNIGLYEEGGSLFSSLASLNVPNLAYPTERFDSFIARMIDLKKARIEVLLRGGKV